MTQSKIIDMRNISHSNMITLISSQRCLIRKIWCKHYFCESGFKTETMFGEGTIFLNPDLRLNHVLCRSSESKFKVKTMFSVSTVPTVK